MVCSDCEKKSQFLDRSVICPDPFKDGSRNSTTGEGSRKLNPNMLLSKRRGAGINPYERKCELCKQRVHDGGIYCQDCAYAKGLCRLCGKVVLTGREFYKSFYSEANQKKFAPKRDANEALPEGEGEDNANDSTEGKAPEKKKVKKVKKSDGSDASKRAAIKAAEDAKEQADKVAAQMADFVKDEASGFLYNAKTQQYYDPNSQLYYTYSNNAWYFWDAAKGEYQMCGAEQAQTEAAEAEPVKVNAMSDIAAEIAAAAGPGSLPLEKAREKAKTAFSGLRG